MGIVIIIQDEVQNADVCGDPSLRSPSRIGKKMLSGFLDPEKHKAFRLRCLERDVSVQDALEAFVDSFIA